MVILIVSSQAPLQVFAAMWRSGGGAYETGAGAEQGSVLTSLSSQPRADYATSTQPRASFQPLSCTVLEGQLKIHRQFSMQTASAVRVCVLRQYLIRFGLVSSVQGLEEKLIERDCVLTPSFKGRAVIAGFAHFFLLIFIPAILNMDLDI